MCELLVMAYDKHNDDTDKDRGCWKEGMVVVTKPDGWAWSETEQNSYLIVKLPGIDEADVEQWMRYEYNTTSGDIEDPKTDQMYRRRRYKLDLSNITQADLDALANTMTSGAIRIAALNTKTIDLH